MLYYKMNVVGEYKNIKGGEFYGDKSFYFIFMGWRRTSRVSRAISYKVRRRGVRNYI